MRLVDLGLSVLISADESSASTEASTSKVILDSSLILGVTVRFIPTSFSVICLLLFITVPAPGVVNV